MAKARSKITKQVAAKAAAPSTYAAVSGLAAGLAPLFPQYAAALAAISLISATVGTFLPSPAAKASAPREVNTP